MPFGGMGSSAAFESAMQAINGPNTITNERAVINDSIISNLSRLLYSTNFTF
ncbi:MAG TPA: hypothetical protein VJI33_04235 [Candidatus Paceibacterota bacterium]